ncbi:2OG-Fe(II) oxygenase [Aliisedimentitalea scapharcae]|uniref:2OG-Fe(II) oxygenase n=1 Tax=Aliisedimentitalea scapharcae TaxID=1524259 RepID=A0ABZ2XYQ1_9RHOB
MRDILDLDQFPLDRPGSPEWQDLVDRCRTDLERDGMFNLHELMHPHVAQQTAKSLSPSFATQSFRHERDHNIYFQDKIDGLADDHPALTRFKTSNLTLCADQLGGSALLRLYDWPEFATFMAATMGKEDLFTMSDPLARVNVMSYCEGQELNWHFDRSEFTTTMLMQAPDQGGEFIYRTGLRSDDDPNYDGVARMLRGDDPDVQSITLSPGTLNIFRGKNTPHRVGTVKGETPRVIAVFSFFDRPGVTFTPKDQIGFYGRAA